MDSNWLVDRINVIIVIIILLTIVSLGVLGIYGGIESGTLTLTTLPTWIWENDIIFYLFVGFISGGHCLAQIVNIDTDSLTDKQKKDHNAGLLYAVLFSGLLWPGYWSFVIFSPIYKKITETKEKNEGE